ncbi:MAG TPA: LysR family transcriptional regulator [Caulobacteraceae bacterium]|nr:LysR family transcriptional regulator [Caulobacteraceae bacterium]
MDRLDAYAAFVAVSDAGSFAAAARRLRQSPSAVTRQIAALEARLGARLLQRTTRAVRLTEAGERLLVRARALVQAAEEAEREAAGLMLEPRGRLVVSAPLMFGRLHVAPVVGRFLAAHPAATAELRLSDGYVSLVEEGVDVAVRIGHLADSGLVSRRLGQTRRMLVAAPAYLAARGAPADPADLAGHDAIGVLGGPEGGEWRLGPDRSQRVRIEPRLAVNSTDAALAFAISGGGIAFLLSYQAAPAIAAGELVEVLPAFAPPPQPIQAVFPSARLMSAAARVFLDQLAVEARWDAWG